jgi:hypothetical protein
MRAEAANQSEMVNQILFGEHFEILKTEGDFSQVRSMHDDYIGFVSSKMITPISEAFARELSDSDHAVTNKPFANCYIATRNENILLTGGSSLPGYNPATESFCIGSDLFRIAKEQVNMPLTKNFSGDEMLSVAFMYLNTPYLWGGRNAFGIDCSGFVQVVMNICGCRFPRDAARQVERGSLISFLPESRSGDLAFFENPEGRISHVGILINNTQIIHASGSVRIDSIDAQGIINEQTGKHSHKLRVIKRVL